jgi:competence protein ComEC
VLAVSGMHVGVIFLVMSYLLGFMDKKRGTRIAKSLIIIVFLWFYAFVTGLPPSAIRATFMLSFVVLSKVVNSNTQTYNNVFAAAFFMLLYSPYFLFDIGFQFSYLAVLGIVYYQPKFSMYFRNKHVRAAWSLLAVSLAAQLTTTPISLYYFNYFPNYFWISNIVVVPAISWIIYLAFGLFFTSQVPYLNDIIAMATTWTIRIINEFIFFIERLPYAVTDNIWVDGWQLITVYVAIVLFTIAAVYRHGKSLIVGLALVAVLFSVNSYTQHQTNTSGNRMLVAAMTDGYGISFVSGATSYLLTDNDFQALRALSPYLMRHRINQPIMIDRSTAWFDEDGFVSFGGKRMLILSENIFEGMIVEQPLELDYLILTNNSRISMPELTQFVKKKKIIIDQSYRHWVVDRIKADCRRLDIAYYVVGESGAFLVKW